MNKTTLKELPYSPSKGLVYKMYPGKSYREMKATLYDIMGSPKNNKLSSIEFIRLICELGVPAYYKAVFVDGVTLEQRKDENNIK